MIKEEYEKDNGKEERGVFCLERIIARKLVKPYSMGFNAIVKEDKKTKSP